MENYTRHAQQSLDGVLAACAADPDCGARYPDLAVRFEEALASAYWNGYPGEPQRVAETVRLLLYDTFSLPALPRVLDAYADDDDGPLFELFSGSSDFSAGSTDGMMLSVICRERAPILSLWDLVQAHVEVGTFFAGGLFPRWWAPYAACRRWPSGTLDLAEREPVVSDVPTLILVGEFDPVTPREYAEMAASTLSNAQIIEFPGVGHAVVPSGNCPFVSTLRFLRDPTLPLPTDCVQQEYGPIVFE